MPTDGRQLSEESLQLLRRQAHRLRHEMNLTWGHIAQIVGVSLSTLMVWVRRFHLNREELGEVASLRRGREYGQKRTLSEADEQALRDVNGGQETRVFGGEVPFLI
jgi:transposase